MNEETETEDQRQEAARRVGGDEIHGARHRARLVRSKPWGDTSSYDFVVGRPGRFVCVQVKSIITELPGGYICNIRAGHHRYPAGAFDFLAAYVVFEDTWYIISAGKIEGKFCATLFPKSKKAKYEKYREAWNLLREARVCRRHSGLC